jgi:hypothetical protein
MLLLGCYFSLYHCIWLYENKDIYMKILFSSFRRKQQQRNVWFEKCGMPVKLTKTLLCHDIPVLDFL